MNDTKRNNEHEDDGIRNILRRLPRVKASADFERRLDDALRKDSAGRRATGLFAGFRIPAPAYSFATLLVLGAAVYYAFFRTGTLPGSSPDSSKHTESGDVIRSDSQTVQTQDALEQASKEVAKEDRREFAAKKAPSPAPGQTKRSSRKDAAAPAVSYDAAGKNAVNDRQQSAGVDAKSAAAPVRPSAEESAQEFSQPKLKKAEDEPARGVTSAMPPPPDARATQTYPGQKSIVTPKTKTQTNSFRAASPAASSVVFEVPLDSIRMRDSLRADSLRKARADSLKKKEKPH